MGSTNGRAPRVLVTGGSIAGPALVWALRRAGFEPTLMERAAQRREAGQNVDVRGAGHEVLHRMGLHDAVAAANTGEVGTRFLGPDGRPYATFPARPGQDGPTAELEVLRGELSRLLLELTSDEVEHRYGDHLVEVRQDGDGVDVVTAAGRRERYDLLLVAEGRRSRTRGLVFGDVVAYRDKGVYIAYGTIGRTDGDDDWWHWFTALDSRIACLRPDNVGTMRANLGFVAPPMGLDRLDVDTQLRVLRERFAGAGWQVDRILDGFAARPDQYYCERWEQVRMPRWSRGRVAVVGDAAWAAGASGMGTTMALVGTHVLAGELANARRGGEPFDPAAAYRRYEELLRPCAQKVERGVPGLPRLVYPRTRTGAKVLEAVHRFTATRAVRGVFERTFLSSGSASPDLPVYPQSTTGRGDEAAARG